jgi:hypothetical protein
MGEKEKLKIDFGFKIFVISTEVIVLLVILGGVWLIDKLLLAPPLIVSFRLVRVKIETKYDVFHCASIFACMIVSTLICWGGLYLSLPIAVSFISNVIIGVGFAIITWHIQDIINIKRKYTFKDELIAKCKAKGYNEIKTQMAIKFFVEKEKPKAVWEWLCQVCPMAMSWDSVKNLKSKMKKDLFL